MKKVVLIILVSILLFGCQKYLSLAELKTKLNDMANEAFATDTYKDLPTGSYVIKLVDLIKFVDEEDVFINPKTKKACDKNTSMAILDIKEENGVTKRTVATILVCD